MAAGYLHNATVDALLAAGADPSTRDRSGRDVTGLVESLREKLPNAAAMAQRMKLEEVARALTFHAFEDVLPRGVAGKRVTEAGEEQYLVQWVDGAEDCWVPREQLSEEVRCKGSA